MVNIKNGLLEHIRQRAESEVTFVKVTIDPPSGAEQVIQGTLESVLPLLDIDYDEYGLIRLEGCIWYADGTWSEFQEFEGDGWWAFRKRPELPTNGQEPVITPHDQQEDF